jgi:hypothetical protein
MRWKVTMQTARLVLLSALLAASTQADLWTNQAGRVIEARLDGFDGSQVTLVRTNGAVLKLPLKALCPADQRRVQLQHGRSIAPLFVQAACRDARSVLDRFERLPAEQRTEEARAQAQRMACAVFDARLKPRLGELKDKQVLEEVKRLRASLGGKP